MKTIKEILDQYLKSQGIKISNENNVAKIIESRLSEILPSIVHAYGEIVEEDLDWNKTNILWRFQQCENKLRNNYKTSTLKL